MKQLSKSMTSSAKTLYAGLKLLSKNEGHMRWSNIVRELENSLTFTTWEKELMKSGYARWSSLLSFYSIDAKKAGYINKKSGEWYLTKEGEQAIKKMTPEELIIDVSEKYKSWRKVNANVEDIETDNQVEEVQQVNLDQLEDQALSQLEGFIRAKNPYEFQDIVAALLRGMGYYTPFIAPKGKDNGIDIIAYKDPLGIEKPIIKVQVKHHPDSAVQSQDIQKLKGTLSHEEEVGIFVTSGWFSTGALREARTSKSHIETIDFGRLIELWKQFYHKLSDEDKNLMPLYAINFLGSNE